MNQMTIDKRKDRIDIEQGFERDYILGKKEAIISLQGVVLSEILQSSELRSRNAAYDKRVYFEEVGKSEILQDVRDYLGKLARSLVDSLLEPETCSEDAIFKALKEEEPSSERLERIERCLAHENGVVSTSNRAAVLTSLIEKWKRELNQTCSTYEIKRVGERFSVVRKNKEDEQC